MATYLKCPKCSTPLEAHGMQPLIITQLTIGDFAISGSVHNDGCAMIAEVVCPKCHWKVEDIWDDEQYCRDLAPDFVLDQIEAARTT